MERLDWTYLEYMAPFHYFNTPDGRMVWIQANEGGEPLALDWWLDANDVNRADFEESYNGEA